MLRELVARVLGRPPHAEPPVTHDPDLRLSKMARRRAAHDRRAAIAAVRAASARASDRIAATSSGARPT